MVQQIFEQYHGDTTVAVVVDGVVVRSFERGQTGAVMVSNNPDHDRWAGETVETLKANGFAYKWTENAEEAENPGC